ncbi:MAG TPA: protein kinase [Kofleriaceae bacterium]|jgi:serine/threonine protein kinase
MIREKLAAIAAAPPARWDELLATAFPDDAVLRAQARLWLAAERADAPALDERYVLATRLDSGASAEVWQAFDRKLGRHVAIKLFHEADARALAEARAACDVISDHVVRVLDVHDGARPYIVMELIAEHDPKRGTQISGASAEAMRPRDSDEAVRWVRDVARGVHAAHLRDVFHRDLKPDNVLIAPVSRRARIADFGLAVAAGSFAGTPEYLAPEQARGVPPSLDAGDAAQRARLVAIDVWGLGALAYDLVGGSPPWRGAGPLEAWEVAASGTEPVPLAKAPPRLRRVIAKATALDPAARYPSAADVGDELDAYLAQRPTSLDRSRALRTWLWCRRNPQLSLTAGAAVVLATLTLAAYVTVVDLRARSRELTAQVADQENANSELEVRVATTRREAASAEADLRAKTETLAKLHQELTDEESSYRAIIAARDKSLHDADAATRALVDQLTIARSDRAAAELGRSMYEGFWTSARQEADRTAKDRDQALKERDAARGERDAAGKDRDAARAERDKLAEQLATAQDEVARLNASASVLATRIGALEHQLGGPPGDAGVPDSAK